MHFRDRVYEERMGRRERWWALWRVVHGQPGAPAETSDTERFAAFVRLRVKVTRCAEFLTVNAELADWDERCALMLGWASEGQALFAALLVDLACTAIGLWGLAEYALRPKDEETRGL